MSQRSIEDLEAPQRLSHQRWEWVIERVGWALMACVVVAGVLGGLGPGPLGSCEAVSPDGSLTVNYYAVERIAAPNSLELQITPGSTEQSKIELSLSRSFADGANVESLVPSPAETRATDSAIIYTFLADDLSHGNKIVCRYQHEHFGVLKYQVSIANGQPIAIRQLVLP